MFYGKGKEKADLLAKHLDRKVVNLGELVCPRVENLNFKNYPACHRHSQHNHSSNHCALKKRKPFFDWLKNEQQRETSEVRDVPIFKN